MERAPHSLANLRARKAKTPAYRSYEASVNALNLSVLLLLALLAAPLGAVSASASAAASIGAPASYSDCALIGYVAGTLDCATCDALKASLESSDEEAACRACCSTTVGWRSARRYDSARLVVPKASAFGGFGGMFSGGGMMGGGGPEPGVKEFLEKKEGAARWGPRLQVSQAEGAGGSVLVMLTDEDGADEGGTAISVASWKWEVIDAFLRQKLRKEA